MTGATFVARALAAVAPEALGRWLAAQRWCGVRGGAVERVRVVDAVDLEPARAPGARTLGLGVVELAASLACATDLERYVALVALARADGGDDGPDGGGLPGAFAAFAAFATGRLPGNGVVAVGDGTDDPAAPRALVGLIARDGALATARGGAVVGRAGAGARELLAESPAAMAVRRSPGEQSNTSYVLGDRVVLKLLRRVEPGVHPDVELPEFLARHGFARAPRGVGVVTYRAPGRAGADAALAVAQQWVPNHGDAWSLAQADLAALGADGGPDPVAAAARMRRLGEVTGEMHVALAAETADPAFAPEPIGPADRGGVVAAGLRSVAEIMAVARRAGDGDGGPGGLAAFVPLCADVTAALRRGAERLAPGLVKTRIHGDYHLGQVLATDGGFVVIDFEGEPTRPLAARRAKASPLRDVAGMLRSFSYAAGAARRGQHGAPGAAAVAAWETAAREAFVQGYLRVAANAAARIVPDDDVDLGRSLALFELEKALYEVLYEVRHRPAWVGVALEGVRAALEAAAA